MRTLVSFSTILCLAFVANAGLLPGADVPDANPPQAVDFYKQVYPIFASRCFKCHGPMRQEGNLRLDARGLAENGGHSGGMILGGDLETNQIFVRVTADDVALMMPKGDPPLSEHEIDIIRRWVEQGTLWPPPPADLQQPKPMRPHRYAFSRDDLRDWNPYDWSDSRFHAIEAFIWRWLPWIAAMCVFVLACERAKRIQASHPDWITGWLGRPVRFLADVPVLFHLFMMTAWLVVVTATYYHHQTVLADQEVDRLSAELRMLNDGPTKVGDEPPRPVFPGHPPRLGGEYYRGNDERSPTLFNGGFYRTAIMRVALCDQDHQELQWGDPVNSDELLVRIEVEKSPFTVESLFSDQIWQSTFATPLAPGVEVTDKAKQVVTFEKMSDVLRVCYVPINIATATAGNPATGVIYICRGTIDASVIDGDPHYAAEYSLVITDGKIDQSSVLWMGYVFKTSNVIQVKPGQIAADEWFSFRPIPEMTQDQQVHDEKLLGITEHKGELERGDKEQPQGVEPGDAEALNGEAPQSGEGPAANEEPIEGQPGDG